MPDYKCLLLQAGRGGHDRNAPHSIFRLAISASLLVHLGLFYWFADIDPGAGIELPEKVLSGHLQLSLSKLAAVVPQAPVPEPEDLGQEIRTEDLTAQAPQTAESSTAELITAQSSETSASEPHKGGAELAGDAVDAESAHLDSAEDVASAALQTDIQTLPLINPMQLNEAIAATLSQHRQELTGNWLGDCMRYQQEHGVRKCPQAALQQPAQQQRELAAELFRTTVNARYLEKREIQDLKSEMTLLGSLMKQEGPAANIAKTRYAKARGRLWELQPADNSNTIPIITFSLGASGVSISLLSGLMTLNSNGEFSIGGEQVLNVKASKQTLRIKPAE